MRFISSFTSTRYPMRARSLILPRSSLYEGEMERLAVGNALNAWAYGAFNVFESGKTNFNVFETGKTNNAGHRLSA